MEQKHNTFSFLRSFFNFKIKRRNQEITEKITFMCFIVVESSSKNNKGLASIVYIHGESFEWNSGNPYDGSVIFLFTSILSSNKADEELFFPKDFSCAWKCHRDNNKF